MSNVSCCVSESVDVFLVHHLHAACVPPGTPGVSAGSKGESRAEQQQPPATTKPAKGAAAVAQAWTAEKQVKPKKKKEGVKKPRPKQYNQYTQRNRRTDKR